MDDAEQYIWNEERGRNGVIKRMVKAYQKRKREKKIKKLANDSEHWKGLE